MSGMASQDGHRRAQAAHAVAQGGLVAQDAYGTWRKITQNGLWSNEDGQV